MSACSAHLPFSFWQQHLLFPTENGIPTLLTVLARLPVMCQPSSLVKSGDLIRKNTRVSPVNFTPEKSQERRRWIHSPRGTAAPRKQSGPPAAGMPRAPGPDAWLLPSSSIMRGTQYHSNTFLPSAWQCWCGLLVTRALWHCQAGARCFIWECL